MTRRTLWLHIGHEKTGSTFLQSLLLANREKLNEDGFEYPLIGDHDPDYRPEGYATPSGNGRNILRNRASVSRHLPKLAKSTVRDIILSSEMMFDQLLEWDMKELVDEVANAGFDTVAVLLFVRAPTIHAASTWQQRVKGWQGETRDLDDWVASAYDTPAQVRRLLSKSRHVGGLDLTLRNYDHDRSSLKSVLADWLGVEETRLETPERSRANRSLTAAEAQLQLSLNRTGKHLLKDVGHALVDRVEDPPGKPLLPGRDAADAMLSRLVADLDAVDQELPEGEGYDRRTGNGGPTPDLVMNEGQLAIVAESVAAATRSGGMHELRRRIARRLRLLKA